MTRRKKDMGEHVTLSKETVNKLLSAVPPPGEAPTSLSPWDVLALARAEHEVVAASMQLKLVAAEERARKLALELAAVRQIEESKKANEALQGAVLRNQKLAERMADSYGFSWQTHSYNPETGEILESAPES